jgi:hypothetical protein
MEQKYQDFQKTIKKKHSVNFTPKYKEIIPVSLSDSRLLVEVAVKTVEALEWELVYQDDETVEARQSNGRWSGKYALTISTGHAGEVEVKSQSLGDELWDNGNNSKRVKLFVYAFNEILKDYKQTNLTELKKEIERKDKMTDYVIPDILPQPATYKNPDSLPLWLGLCITAVLFAVPAAFLSWNGLYIIGIFEFGFAWILATAARYLFKISNYTDWKVIHYMLIAAVAIVFVSNLFFQYLIYLDHTRDTFTGFFDFVSLRIEAGIRFKELDLGVIGLIVVWALNIWLMYILGKLFLLGRLVRYSISRVPEEVAEFAAYHFSQNGGEENMKKELTKMGWKTEQEHQMVLEAFDGIVAAREMRRAK